MVPARSKAGESLKVTRNGRAHHGHQTQRVSVAVRPRVQQVTFLLPGRRQLLSKQWELRGMKLRLLTGTTLQPPVLLATTRWVLRKATGPLPL